MQAAGFTSVADASKAEYLVSINYTVGKGRTVTGSRPIYGQTGGGRKYTTGTFSGRDGYSSYRGIAYATPTYGVVGSAPYTRTTYAREFTLDIVEKKNSRRVFQGRVTSVGSNSNFATVSRCMFNAMFEGFPGENGATKKSEVDLKTCKK